MTRFYAGAMTADRVPEAQRLLSLAADHLLAHGTSGVSLSRLAKAIGSNNRMLLYYFGSKDDLFTAAIRAAYLRFPRLRALASDLGQEGELVDVLSAAWQSVRAEENLPYTRLFFESFGIAARAPEQSRSQLAALSVEWPGALESLFRRHGRPDARTSALQVLALWRGLQFSLLEGVPLAVLDEAHDAAVACLVT